MAMLMYFGRFSDLATSGETTLPSNVRDTDALVAWVSRDNPRFAELMDSPGVSVLVNEAVVSHPYPVADGDRIAFLSVLSGG